VVDISAWGIRAACIRDPASALRTMLPRSWASGAARCGASNISADAAGGRLLWCPSFTPRRRLRQSVPSVRKTQPTVDGISTHERRLRPLLLVVLLSVLPVPDRTVR
jgi:hypothetical protein